MSNLHLNLKGEYFDQIKAGVKIFEFRLANDYWKKRLEGKRYEKIYIKRGYPKKDDKEKILTRPWKGASATVITHKYFGERPVIVYAIRVN